MSCKLKQSLWRHIIYDDTRLDNLVSWEMDAILDFYTK